MSFWDIETQKLVTGTLIKLYDFYFDGTTVKLSDYDYIGYTTIEIEMSGIRSDLTGAVSEPSLSISCDKLWDTDWAIATAGFTGLGNYKGIKVERRRFLDGNGQTILPQTFFIKSVNELNAREMTFTLTPSLGGDRLDLPSARKLEL